MIMLMLIPTTITIWLAIQVKQISKSMPVHNDNEIQVVCFDVGTCLIEVQHKWYSVSGVIDMDSIIPEEYKLDDITDSIETTPNN